MVSYAVSIDLGIQLELNTMDRCAPSEGSLDRARGASHHDVYGARWYHVALEGHRRCDTEADMDRTEGAMVRTASYSYSQRSCHSGCAGP